MDGRRFGVEQIVAFAGEEAGFALQPVWVMYMKWKQRLYICVITVDRKVDDAYGKGYSVYIHGGM